MTACGGNLIDGEISRNEQSPLCGVATIEAAAKHRYVDRNEAQPGRKRRPKIQWFRREQYYYSLRFHHVGFAAKREPFLRRLFSRACGRPAFVVYWEG